MALKSHDDHLDWSSKQKRILTGGERAEEFYTAERGYPFEESELPHFHLIQGDTHAVFQEWNKQSRQKLTGTKREREEENASLTICTPSSPLVGTWKRLLFFGGWEHTNTHDERTYNLQTRNLFIDLRIPTSREGALLRSNNATQATSLDELTKEELRCYARQHVFAGYTQMTTSTQGNNDLLCTRHHCIDWNFVGQGRSRPNKWYAELQKADNGEVKTWKEWAYAKDDRGQHYYCEQWERLGEEDPVLALRKQDGAPQDGLLLIVGDHFNYVLGRDLSSLGDDQHDCSKHSSLVAVVDAALDRDDLATARAYLSIRGGHGLVSAGWVVDCAIEPWKEGKPLWDKVSVQGEHIRGCQVVWNEEVWEVFDTTLTSVQSVKDLVLSKRS